MKKKDFYKNNNNLFKDDKSTKILVSGTNLYKVFIDEIIHIFHKYYDAKKTVADSKDLISLIIFEVFNKFLELHGFKSNQHINSCYITSFCTITSAKLKVDSDESFLIFIDEIKSLINTFPFSVESEISDNSMIKPDILSGLVETLLSHIWFDNGNTIRKSNGIFFTPVEVIDYINKKTLYNYLKSFFQTNIEKNYVKSLIYDENSKFNKIRRTFENEQKMGIYKINKKLIDLLNSIKIIDPAMGASDFLVNYTNLLFTTLKRLKAVPNERKSGFIFNESITENNPYLYKKIIWECNIYGIDIEKISVEASIYRGLLDALYLTDSSNIELIEFNFIWEDSLLIGSKNYESRFLEEFDIVVGNPPYINLKNIEQDIKEQYSKLNYTTFTSQSDLYILFYELGFNLLKNNGHLMYITSDKWMKSRYGLKLRNFLLEHTSPKILIELGTNIFEDAAVDTNILLFSKSKYKNSTKILKFEDRLNKLKSIDEKHFTDIRFKKNTNWLVLNKIEINIMKKLEVKSQYLRDLPNVKIRRGILTGLNKAYIINNNTRDSILNTSLSKEERLQLEKIIVPIINGKDIRKHTINWSGNFLINFHNGYSSDHKYNQPLNIDHFPSLKKHFNKFESQLKNRTDKGKTFYNLRNCAYIDEFSKNKIIWPEISSDVTFVEDDTGIFLGTSAYMMINYPKWLLSYLNSSLFKWYFTKHSLTLGTKANRFTKQFIETSLIPNDNPFDSGDFYKFYNLTKEEKEYIKKYFL